ncbi:MAG: hypothetical protein CMJ49_10950 [Planctomycetaceae bacterium]|nr:hypothetical protein [Planctomycetaceae bacterium]
MSNPSITVRRELYAPAPDDQTSEGRSQCYVNGDGLRRVEHRTLQRESDWTNARFTRRSDDNGRTWDQWQDVHDQSAETKGDDEIYTHQGAETFNPHHNHFVSVSMRRIFFGGHHKAYEAMWGRGEAQYVDHSMLTVRPDRAEQCAGQLIKYEPGADYDPQNWRDPNYIDNNRAYFGGAVDVLDNGDILFTIAAAVRACCRIRGLDIHDIFPSCPDIMCGMIVVRGSFNPARGNYDLTFSRPIVISDLKSSRGVCEPAAIRLPSGRILAVFRGSNVISENWNTRILPGTPAHKWFCYSDDGGETFTDPVPWHFDDADVFYSPATISALLRSEKNQNLYWIGNITDHTAYGNGPRYPLLIAQLNDHGLLIKDTLTVIDKREPQDSPELQLSNFAILQDRPTGLIELYLSKLGQRPNHLWHADCYRYLIDLP